MKTISFLLSCLIAGYAFGTPNIHEALKNPSTVTVLELNGTANESNLLLKNAAKFTALQKIIVYGISDSTIAEQDFIAVAACSNVTNLSIDHCGLFHLSDAIKMLVSVNEVAILNCEKLEINSAFSSLAGMPSLNSISYSTNTLTRMPLSFARMRGMKKINITNEDLTLADGYALNNSSRESLFVKEQLDLGFGNSILELQYGCYDKTFAKEHISILRDLLQGAVGINGELRLPQKEKAFRRNHPLVKAPIPGLEVQKNIYSTDGTKGGEIEYPSGTKILIPDHAFVDREGNSIQGAVTVDYREFRDPVDIMVSGIPMDYDSGGVKGHFVSAGMFEMNASVNGKEVFLAPGKNVSMKFAVVDTAADFNFYKLDEKKGWVYENSPGKVEKGNGEFNDKNVDKLNVNGNDAQITVAVKAYYDWTQSKTRWNAAIQGTENDTLDFDSRYENKNYTYTEQKNKGKRLIFFSNDYYYYDNAFTLQRTYHHKGTVCFRIIRNYKSENSPEINAFSGVEWETTDAVTNPELKQLFRKKSGINDMRIYKDGDGFILEFKTKKGKKQIHAVPTYLRKSGPKEYSEKSQASMFKRYTKVLNKRRNNFNADIANNKKNIAKRNEKIEVDNDMNLDSVAYWKKIEPKMNANEKAMDFTNWLSYYKKQMPGLIKANQQMDFAYVQITEGSTVAGKGQAEALYQELKVSGFGIYNCDHCGTLQAPVATNAQFQVPGMASPSASNVYVIDRAVNSSTNFFTRAGGPVNITYNKGSKTSLIIIDKDGKLYYTNSDAFAAGTATGGSNTRYEATMISDQLASPQQIRDLITAKN